MTIGSGNGHLIEDIDRFHDAILDYLDSSGFTRAADTLRTELKRTSSLHNQKSTIPHLLERKWLASTKLQISLLYYKNELRRKQERQSAFNALLGLKATQDTTPNDARDSSILDWKVEGSNIALSSTCPLMAAAISPEKSNIKFFRTDGRSIVSSNKIAHLKVPVSGGGTSVVAFAPDGLKVLMAARGRVYLFQLDTLTNEYVLQDQFLEVTPGDKEITAVLPWCAPGAWAFSNLQVCTVTADTIVQTWDWKENRCTKEILTLKLSKRIKSQCITSSTNEIFLILGFDNGKISRYVLLSDSNSRDLVISDTEIQAHDRAVDCLISFGQDSPNEEENRSVFISSGRDNAIRVWNAVKMECIQQLDGHSNWVRALAIHPSCNLLASSSDDRTLRFWDLNTGREVKKFVDVATFAEKMFFDFNGRHLVVVSSTQMVEVWNCSRVVSLKGDDSAEILNNSNLQFSTSQFSTPSRMSPYSVADSCFSCESSGISPRRPRLGVAKTPPEKDKLTSIKSSILSKEAQDEFIARLNIKLQSKNPSLSRSPTLGTSSYKLGGLTTLNMRKVMDQANSPRPEENGAAENSRIGNISTRLRTARLPNTSRAKSPPNTQRLMQKSNSIRPDLNKEDGSSGDKSNQPISCVTTDTSLPSRNTSDLKSMDERHESDVIPKSFPQLSHRKESTESADYSANFIPTIDPLCRGLETTHTARTNTTEDDEQPTVRLMTHSVDQPIVGLMTNSVDQMTEQPFTHQPENNKITLSSSTASSRMYSGLRRGSVVITKPSGSPIPNRRSPEAPSSSSTKPIEPAIQTRKYSSEGLSSTHSAASTNGNKTATGSKIQGSGQSVTQQFPLAGFASLAKPGVARNLTKAAAVTTNNSSASTVETTGGLPSFMAGVKKGSETRKPGGAAPRRNSVLTCNEASKFPSTAHSSLTGGAGRRQNSANNNLVEQSKTREESEAMLASTAPQSSATMKPSIASGFRRTNSVATGPNAAVVTSVAQRLLGRRKASVTTIPKK